MIEYPWLFAFGMWWMCGHPLGIPVVKMEKWDEATTQQKIGRVIGSVLSAATGIVLVAMSFK